jgi:hypothetical protein
MQKSYDQTFMLTTSLVAKSFPQACIPQSALIPVRSVECGLFA